jgi:replicative DNA helicase Mcm
MDYCEGGMTPDQAINIAHNYFETIEKKVIVAVNKEAPLIVDFMDLAKYNPELAELLLDQFNEYFDLLMQGLQSVANRHREEETQTEGGGVITPKLMKINFINIPESRRILIGNLRSKDLGKLIFTDGKIRTKTDVRPQVIKTRFECPSCANIITIIQLDTKFKEPSRCSCGRKGKFRLLGKEFTDMQRLSIQENFRDLQSGEQPRHIDVYVSGMALTSPIKERRYLPGNLIRVIGVLRESPKYLRTGDQSTAYDILIEANNIINLDQEAGDIEITKEEEEKILKLSKDTQLEKYIYDSIAPGVLGADVAKRAAMLFLFNGPHYPTQIERLRGNFSILFIGDPSTGKSKMLEYMHSIHPRSGIVEGPGLTAVGLTANILKDEHFGWILEGGALVLYNGGCLIIDELEKATDEAKNALHGPMERNIVSISKANIKADLPAETCILAAANPKDGTFNVMDEIRGQIELPDTLFSRFDLVIPFFDRPSEETKAVSKFILKKFENAGKGILKEHLIDTNNPFSDTTFFKKYVLYAMRHCNPIITDTKCKALTEFFDKVKNLSDKKSTITLRQMEALIRLTAAHAKMRLSEYATGKDAEFVIQLFKDMYKLFGWDVDAGEAPDIQAIFEAGFTMSKQEQKDAIIHTLRMAFKLNATKTIIKSLLKHALMDAEIFKSEEEFDNLVEKLIKIGDLYIPKIIDVDGVREEVIGYIE